MRLEDITPVILTLNEEPNIGRVLARLSWAKDIVVVDSYSADRTAEIVKQFANTRFIQRRFDNHARQWSFACGETGIETEWILGLDSDLLISDAFRREMTELDPAADIAGYDVVYRMCMFGHPVPRSTFPPRVLLFRRRRGSFRQDGHTQRLIVDGRVERMHSLVDHDDRKSVVDFINAQCRYARLEKDKLDATDPSQLRLSDRLRKLRIVAPIATLVYHLVFKRLMFSGLAGWHYTYQRVVWEIILSQYLTEEKLSSINDGPRNGS